MTSIAMPIDEKDLAPVWRRALWMKQPFPDDHVPPDFLSELDRPDLHVRPSLPNLIIASLPISHHLAAIAIFIAIFYRLLIKDLGAGEVSIYVIVSSLFGWLLLMYGWTDSTELSDTSRPKSIRGLIIPPLILSLLSPILGTLTSATTSDTIWPLAGGLFFVHLLLSDCTTGPDKRVKSLQRRKEKEMRDIKRQLEGLGKGTKDDGDVDVPLREVVEKSLSSSLSLTSALSASLVLASRLSDTSEVFALILLAIALFAGWPEVAKRVRESGKLHAILLTLSTTLTTFSIIPPSTPNPVRAPGFIFSPPVVILAIILITANILAPALFWYAWRWKTRRGGGWDVATVRVRVRDGS